MKNLCWLTAFFLAITLLPVTARAADITVNVLTAGGTSDAEEILAAHFTKQTGIKIAIVHGSTGAMRDRLHSDAPADLIILSATAIDALSKSGELKAESLTALGDAPLGLAVPVGAPKPDISTPESFRTTLLNAKAVLYGDPKAGGSSGFVAAALLQKPEFTAVKSKLPSKRSVDALAEGEGDVALELVSEILTKKEIVLAGTFPAPYAEAVSYVAAIPAKSTQGEQADAFLRFITAHDAAIVWHRFGIEAAH